MGGLGLKGLPLKPELKPSKMTAAAMDDSVETKRKLELYQQLFYILQTRSDYLSKLFRQLAKIDIADKNKKLVERVVLTLFGYGQDRREEYLLLKLFQVSKILL